MGNQSFNIVTSRIDSLELSPRANAMAHGLLLGDKQYFTYTEKQEMRNAGMSHIMAVSGLHIGILFIVFYLVMHPLRWFGHLKLHKLMVTAMLWLYVMLIGCPVSAIRAALMLSLASVSWILERYTTGLRMLLSAAVIMLACDYHQLLDVGFQLSFLATLGIMLCSADMGRIHHPVMQLLRITIAAQCATFPVIAYFFHTVPLLGWIQGLLVIPLLSFLVYCMLLYLLFPMLVFLAYPIEWITDWIFLIADVTSRLEYWLIGGHLALYPTWWETILWAIVMFAVLWSMSERQHKAFRYRL